MMYMITNDFVAIPMEPYLHPKVLTQKFRTGWAQGRVRDVWPLLLVGVRGTSPENFSKYRCEMVAYGALQPYFLSDFFYVFIRSQAVCA